MILMTSVQNLEEAIEALHGGRHCRRKELTRSTSWISSSEYSQASLGSLFADNPLYGGLEVGQMVQLANDGHCDGFLIDTLTKDGRNLFEFMSELQLREIVIEGKQLGMSTALSGHLKLDDLDELAYSQL